MLAAVVMVMTMTMVTNFVRGDEEENKKMLVAKFVQIFNRHKRTLRELNARS